MTQSAHIYRPESSEGGRKTSKRDNAVHSRLVNWGKFVRAGMRDIPRQHPQGASWQQQIVNRGDSIDDLEVDYIDDDDAEITQAGMIRCMIHNLPAATILTQRYRDGWEFDDALLKRARSKFWRYL